MALQLDSSLAFRPNPATAPREPATPAGPQAALAFRRALDGAGQARGALPARHVAAQRTPLTGGEAASALQGAWHELTGHAPSQETLSILVGQWAHETGRGSAMLNFNFGGIKGSGPTGASTVYRTREGSGADEIQIRDTFRAYESAEQGAADYLSLLSRRYPDALQAAERGDATGFVQALKARGYFTGDEASYIKSVSALSRQALTAGFDALGAGAGARAASTAAPLPAPDAFSLTEAAVRAAARPGGATQPELLAALEAAGASGLGSGTSPLQPAGGVPANIDGLLLAARNLHSPEALAPGAWAHALNDEVRRVDLLISALQIGQFGEKEEG